MWLASQSFPVFRPCRGLGPEPHPSWVSRPPLPRRCGAVCVPRGREAGCNGEQGGRRAGTAVAARAAGGAGAWGAAAANPRSAAAQQAPRAALPLPPRPSSPGLLQLTGARLSSSCGQKESWWLVPSPSMTVTISTVYLVVNNLN